MTTTDDKIICPNCKNELPQDSGFCQYCGIKIEVPVVAPDYNKIEINSEPNTEEIINPTDENETFANILDSGIIEEQKAMEANKASQPHNELDADFGLVPQKPVYTVGIDEQEKYLKSLCTINGDPIKWNRRGSMSVDGINGMVDVYDTFLPSGEEYKTIYINMYGASNSNFAPKGFSICATTESVSQKNIKVKRIKKSHLIIGIVITLGLIAGSLAIGIPVYYKKLYQKLSSIMLNVTESNNDDIAALINKLPSGYKDVEDIEKQYKQIQKYIRTIESAYGTDVNDSENAREAYVALYQFNKQNYNWDLSQYLDYITEEQFGRLVFGKQWENSFYSFRWYSDGESEWLTTNLPNDKDHNKEYSFYYDAKQFVLEVNPQNFGYENKNDENDKFWAYRINDVIYSNGKWQIEIYCYSNSNTYILE
ncbi:MAG: hypothetical protein IKB51_02865 [Clostridia bacterium]|nr:hypothetical protein [Clostridia bacterium]